MRREGNDGSHASSIVKLFDYLLTMAWQTYIAKQKKPRVKFI